VERRATSGQRDAPRLTFTESLLPRPHLRGRKHIRGWGRVSGRVGTAPPSVGAPQKSPGHAPGYASVGNASRRIVVHRGANRLDHQRRRLIGVVVSNRHYAKRPSPQRDRVAGSPHRYDRVKRRRVGGCPVLVLESVGEACHSVLFLSRLGPNGLRERIGVSVSRDRRRQLRRTLVGDARRVAT
jgi:hypothetical protein